MLLPEDTYISAPGTRIFADPTTISGSIGVFGLIPNAQKLLEQKLGLTTEIVTRIRIQISLQFISPMNPYEKEVNADKH